MIIVIFQAGKLKITVEAFKKKLLNGKYKEKQ
jgi:hypothetical protein